jgi:hypothetical protein
VNNVKCVGGYYTKYSAGYNLQQKNVIFEFHMADSSLLEHKVICLSTLNLEAARSSEIFETSCQIYDALFQKTDILNSIQDDEGNIQLKILET